MEKQEETGEQLSKDTHHCSICNKYYASSKSYGNHVRSYHSTNKEKAQCPHCGNCFTRRDNLQQHIKLFHGANDVVFSCKNCLRNFRTKYERRKHQIKCTFGKVKAVAKKPSSHFQQGNATVKLPLKPNPDIQSYCNGRPKSVVASKDAIEQKTSFSNSCCVSVNKHSMKYVKGLSENVVLEGDKYPLLSDQQELHMTNHNHESVKNLHSVNCKEIDSQNRALDCVSCNVTFLSKQDYNSHKPFCHELL